MKRTREVARAMTIDVLTKSTDRKLKTLHTESQQDLTRFLHDTFDTTLRVNPFNRNPGKQKKDENAPSLLVTLLTQIPELVNLILCYLGPMELSNALRVSTFFQKLTTSVFLCIAPQLLDLYTVGTEEDEKVPERSADKHTLIEFIKIQRVKQTKPTGTLLKLWFAYFKKYREYSTAYSLNNNISFKYAFVVEQMTLRYARASEINLYQLLGYELVMNACIARHELEKIPLLPSKKGYIHYFNYDDFKKIRFSTPVSGENPHGSKHNLYVVIHSGQNKNDIEFFSKANLSFYPLSISASRSDAFFDMYEMNLLFRRDFCSYDCDENYKPPFLRNCMDLIIGS